MHDRCHYISICQLCVPQRQLKWSSWSDWKRAIFFFTFCLSVLELSIVAAYKANKIEYDSQTTNVGSTEHTTKALEFAQSTANRLKCTESHLEYKTASANIRQKNKTSVEFYLSNYEEDAKLLEDCMTKDHLEQYLNKPEIVVLYFEKEE
ncbi:hypothetical protein T12_6792 [Trichinella patagoniensis]|uniref:Uncharacterized protein n=1 Tax=Trichinella patagoniensis TaxID=990121 RepID=A0A0V1AAY7_9BILA|nr:hypothetical protein T12_6792 [Trichinella patagoniensis]